MRIRRNPSPRCYIAPDLSDAQLLAAIKDPEWVEIERQGDYVRILGMATGEHLPREFPLLEVGYFYLEDKDEALVIWADHASEEDFERWVNQT